MVEFSSLVWEAKARLPLVEPLGLPMPTLLVAVLEVLLWEASLANMLFVKLWNLEMYSRDRARSVARMHFT